MSTQSQAPETATEPRTINTLDELRANRRATINRAETARILDVDKRALDTALDADESPRRTSHRRAPREAHRFPDQRPAVPDRYMRA